MRLVVAGATIAWLIGVALMRGGPGMSVRAAAVSSETSKEAAPRSAVYSPACGLPGYVQAGAQSASPKRQMSDEAFKNVQLLKGIPVDEFMGAMGLFSAATSMCCLECHSPDWAADTPRKITTRKMIQMVNTINQTNFSGRKVVSCWTCHRQSDRPQVTPALDVVYGEPIYWAPDDLFLQAQGAPAPDKVLDKYIQAIGGADRLAKLTSYVGKGSATLFGGGFKSAVELYVKAPNQRALIIHQELGNKTMTFDGHNGWLASAVTPLPVMDLTGGELDGARLDAELSIPGRVKQLLGNWRAALPRDIAGRSVNVLQGTGTGGLTATLFFDVDSGLLTRVVRYANSAMGRVPTQIDFEDYREVAGVKVPFKWSFAWVSGRDVVELTDVQPNVAIDAAKFGKPAPAVAQK
ncbi:MAG TPA: photosynthetic reaction center cytochrome c subunit family protein [Vicinamibacterales bacterium]|nr:photosynthetic reaction center cytochrome c subunit family protein [Vicinamibacterales bacterium]